ncbi:DUF2934 domain-containing protein [Bathymodiolus platifrons methanotrophic gill symbiont]|uniref:DUF2934 domain-containing protein n=1 Tax=Bathymodiolus platifrons methanotrophic gill symbiont TaxID=113268 RepID=UPI0011250452|nr:DUF2934 domain-containing protein [Bathymodiolus platifrons methanotrophic gill symbiont]MCK5871010.1 DUF2934 domain-containing protein [Methyloprofundus sp.]
MPQNHTQKQKWISDAAYFNALNREFKPDMEIKDWIEAEHQYHELIKKRVKSGLVRII